MHIPGVYDAPIPGMVGLLLVNLSLRSKTRAGQLGWIALSLAFSFATYGLVKKIIGMPAVESLGVETALLFVPAMAYLIWLQSNDQLKFGHIAVGTSVLLALGATVASFVAVEPLIHVAKHAASALPF